MPGRRVIVRLVRHASAGTKGSWPGDDADRPLDDEGEAQAQALRRALEPAGVGRLLCSPTARCVQTLEPLAAATDRPAEVLPVLDTDGAGGELRKWLVHEAEDGDVLCTHGETMLRLLDDLADDAPRIAFDADLLAKGTFWELDIDGGRVRAITHRVPAV